MILDIFTNGLMNELSLIHSFPCKYKILTYLGKTDFHLDRIKLKYLKSHENKFVQKQLKLLSQNVTECHMNMLAVKKLWEHNKCVKLNRMDLQTTKLIKQASTYCLMEPYRWNKVATIMILVPPCKTLKPIIKIPSCLMSNVCTSFSLRALPHPGSLLVGFHYHPQIPISLTSTQGSSHVRQVGSSFQGHYFESVLTITIYTFKVFNTNIRQVINNIMLVDTYVHYQLFIFQCFELDYLREPAR